MPARAAAFTAVLFRGIFWTRPQTTRELRTWHRRAEAIPDSTLRRDALDGLLGKRDNVEGAALFSTITKRRSRRLLRLLIAYQVLWDFLDSVSERGASAGQANGRQLHRALVEAIDPGLPLSDYYRYHPHSDDGGYLVTLVETCRRMCTGLPWHGCVRLLILPAVERCAIQSLNHEPDEADRDAALRGWADREFGGSFQLHWFEWTAAASAFIPHVFFALASEPLCTPADLDVAYAAYFPWVSLTIAMLDSYLDRARDLAMGAHSYIAHYPSARAAHERLQWIISSTVAKAPSLPNGNRQAILISGIVAWHLSVHHADTELARAERDRLVRAGGRPTRLLLGMARGWRLTRARLSRRDPGRASDPPRPPLPTALTTYLFWRWPLVYIRACRSRYGACFGLRALSYPRLAILTDESDVKAMLLAPASVLHPGAGSVKLTPIVGAHSFMLLDEEEHVWGRRSVQPALHKRRVEREIDWVSEKVKSAVVSWPHDVVLALHPRLRELTLEVILRRIFTGADFGSAIRLPALREKVLAMLEITSGPLLPLPVLRRGPGARAWRRFCGDRAAVDALIHALIDKRRRHDPPPEGDVLACLLDARDAHGEPQTRVQLRDNAMSLILAGHETTAAQLAWAFQLLAHSPMVQRRLIEEIDADAGDAYLTATIQEVLRHRPVFLFTIPRAVKRPFEIGGRIHRPPAHLLGCIYLLHHDPRTYPDPDAFRPERFLEGQPPPYTWLPWGGGRRRCPGSHLALLEMKTVLRTVLETMTVHPASRRMERPRWRSVIVTPHDGSRVVLRARGSDGGGGCAALERGQSGDTYEETIRAVSDFSAVSCRQMLQNTEDRRIHSDASLYKCPRSRHDHGGGKD